MGAIKVAATVTVVGVGSRAEGTTARATALETVAEPDGQTSPSTMSRKAIALLAGEHVEQLKRHCAVMLPRRIAEKDFDATFFRNLLDCVA